MPASVALALASGGTWRRLVTDPLSGAVLDIGRTRYRPPAALADLVRARDASCTHPGCGAPARRCDLDHVLPWSLGGTTSLTNLTALCEAHHRLKHTPGWSLSRTGEGGLTWRTPTGARYRREPDGTVIRLPRRVGPRSLHVPATAMPREIAEAITAPVLDRLNRGLDRAAEAAQRGTSDAVGRHRPLRVILETRGPRPGEEPGAFESAPYPPALLGLGLAPLLDAVPPF